MVVDSMCNKNSKIKLSDSQNFLHSKRLVSEMIEQSNINKEDVVIEIGAGKGIITEQLVNKCKKVYAIEYDPYLFKMLKRAFLYTRNVDIIYGDFLEYTLPKDHKYKVFSSIPYNITAAILSKLTSAYNPPEDAYIILQEEAARKYAGNPYNRESMRSLLLKPYFDFTIIRKLKNTDFTPVPKVESVLLHIEKREHALIKAKEADLYRDFISYIFSRSGNVKDRCKNIFSYKQLKRLSSDIGFRIIDSPGYLSFQQWLKVFQYFTTGVSDKKRRLVCNSYSKLLKDQKKIKKLHRNRK